MEDEPTTLKQLRNTISKRAAEAKQALTSFTQSLTGNLSAAETSAQNAKTHADSAASQLVATTKSKEAVEQLETDASAAYEKFEEVTQKAMDKKTGVAAVAAAVDTAHQEAIGLKQEISGFRDESLTMRTEIEKNRDDASTAKDTLSTILSDSEETREKIEKTYKIATDAGLAGSLSQRKNALNKQAIAWAIIALLSFAATVFITYKLLPDLLKDNQATSIVLSKIFYISPTALFTIFAISQYRDERRLLEEYAFKAAMANSLESYTQLLGREFSEPEYKQEILDFVLPAMRDIYDRDPLTAPKMTFSWTLGSKLAKLEATVKEEASQITQKTDEVKDDISSQLDDAVDELRPKRKSASSTS